MASSSQQVKNVIAKKVIKESYVKNLLTDFGNIPIVAANSLAFCMIVVVSGRKLFFHPDIGVSDANRGSNDIINETPSRLASADEFRQQTRSFASIVGPLSEPILKLMTGTKQVDDKWKLDFIRKQEIDIPLEQTNFFDDGLYQNENVTSWAENKDNNAY